MSTQQPLRVVLVVVALGLVPALLLAAFVAVGMGHRAMEARDFHMLYVAAVAAAHGRSPYPAHPSSLTWEGGAQSAYPYPPLMALLVAPLTLVSFHTAAVSWVLLSTASVALALWLLDVRDWRCYGAMCLWPSTLTAISVGTISPLLLLGVAATWRLRHRTGSAATTAALTVAAKLFLWPLIPWLWLTGRRMAAVTAALGSVAASLLAWWWLGFAGLRAYPSLLSRLTTVEAPIGYAPAWQLAGYAGIAIAAAACAVAVNRLRPGQRPKLQAATLSALVLTPILWLHYLVLLAAALPKRFSWLWLLPALLWLTPQQWSYGQAWRVALVGSVVALVAVLGGQVERRTVGISSSASAVKAH